MTRENNVLTSSSKNTRNLCIADLFEFCRESGYSMAVWRSPSHMPEGVIDTGDTSVSEIELESSKPGFLFHPFSKDGEKHLIRAEYHFRIEKNAIKFVGQKLPGISEFLQNKPRKNPGKKMQARFNQIPQERASYIELVEKARGEISEGSFQKVVPSRRMKFSVENLDIDELFTRLSGSYPNAFVSATFVPSAGLWIGASPEILVHTHGNQIFETVALAGTQPLNKTMSLHDIAWRQKEIEEQAYVSRYIINCFKKIRLREFDEIGPKTIVAGNLIHLKTTFRVNMQSVNFPQLGTVMMQLLHPTSAVCGMPLEPALNWLKAHEGYDRSYFSGFLGPVNMANETLLYVNLRCMQVQDTTAWIYAGAGVTEDSQPEKEWMETSYKMNTLLDIIG